MADRYGMMKEKQDEVVETPPTIPEMEKQDDSGPSKIHDFMMHNLVNIPIYDPSLYASEQMGQWVSNDEPVRPYNLPTARITRERHNLLHFHANNGRIIEIEPEAISCSDEPYSGYVNVEMRLRMSRQDASDLSRRVLELHERIRGRNNGPSRQT